MVSDKYIEHVLQRMRVWMELRALAPVTVSVYLRCARRFIEHIDRPLGTVKAKEIEQYLLDLARMRRSPSTRNVNLGAIRCALRSVGRRDPSVGFPHAKVSRRSPEILSSSEVTRLLGATTSLKYRAIFMLAYGAGLRVGELVTLQTVLELDPERLLPTVDATHPRAPSCDLGQDYSAALRLRVPRISRARSSRLMVGDGCPSRAM
jgi:integrase/recombinase XerD